MKIFIASMAVLTGCAMPQEQTTQQQPPPVSMRLQPDIQLPTYNVKTFQASDSSGVGSVTCPTSTVQVGGGCHCHGFGVLFGAQPAARSFVCGCFDGSDPDHTVDAVVNCLSSSNASTISQGLSGEPTRPSPEALALAAEFRAARDARR